MKLPRTATAWCDSSDGFSLVEVIVATLVLTVGVLALVGLMTLGVQRVLASSATLVAREKAREAVESVHTARDTGDIAWSRVRNVSAGGDFLDGQQPLRTAGLDGLVNTSDDGPTETRRAPGIDGILKTADDEVVQLTLFTREIRITDLMRDGTSTVNPNLREITVTIRYQVQNFWRTYTLRTYVSAFS